MDSNDIIISGPEMTYDIREGSLAEYLIEKLKARSPGDVMHVNADTGESMTCGEFLDLVAKTSEGLKALGLQQQEIVALVGKNSFNISAAAIGTMCAGGVFGPLDPTLKPLELEMMFKSYNPRIVFCDAECADHAATALRALKSDAPIILLDQPQGESSPYPSYDSILKPVDIATFSAVPVENPAKDLAFIACSSGTTGPPKGVGLTHRNLLFQIGHMERPNQPAQMEVFIKMSVLQTSHFFWVSGIFFLLFSIIKTGKRIFVTTMKEANIMRAVDKCKPEMAMFPPAELTAMLKDPEFKSYDFSSLKMITMGGSALSANLRDLIQKELPGRMLIQGYGMTEHGSGVAAPAIGGDVLSVGKVEMGVQMKLIDVDTGKTLGPNTQGELCFKSPGVMRGYVNNPEATATAIDSQGWLHSGDLGHYTEEGFIYITGRIKEVFKYRNLQVAPTEVEAVIERMDGVLEAGVVGIPHKEDQYHAMALVVKEPGATITAQEVVAFVKENMSACKQLQGGAVFVEALPRTPSKKIKRPLLLKMALDSLEKLKSSDEENIIMGDKEPENIFPGSLGEYLLPKIRARNPDSIMHVNADTGESITTEEFLTMAASITEGLKALGLQSQDVVAMLGRNGIRITAAMLGTVFAGGVFGTLDPYLKAFEIETMFKSYKPRFVFCESSSAVHVAKALDLLNNPAKIILLDDDSELMNNCRFLRFKEVLRPADLATFQSAGSTDPYNELAMIVCSSGSTGLPKGVGLSHRGVLYQLIVYEKAEVSFVDRSILQTSHIFWLSGIQLIVLSCMHDIQRIFITRMDEVNILRAIRKYKPVMVLMPPAELSAMLQLPDYKPEDMSSLVMVALGGSPVTSTLVDLAKKQLPKSALLVQGYGMTENSGGVMRLVPGADILSVGKVLAGSQVKVIDLSGRALGPNTTGELCLKSPGLMKGYVGNPEATKATIDEQGWLHSGDLVYYNDEGFFFVTGRLKELIKYRTQQISPLEVESVIEKMEGVLEAGVAGIPHVQDQYHAMALVVKKPDANITEQDVVQFVKDNMSEFKHLHGGAYFVESIPRTPTKKIKRGILSEMAIKIHNTHAGKN